MSIRPSVARLAAQNARVDNDHLQPEYRPATPGSSAWSIIAKNIRLRLVVPFNGRSLIGFSQRCSPEPLPIPTHL